MTTEALGFRVMGHRAGRRRLVDWRTAFLAYAECDPRAEHDREAYLSHFVFGRDFADYLTANGSEAAYSGSCGADWLHWDIDRPGDLERALSDARRLAGAILDRYRELDDDDPFAFYSGSKGLHFALPTSLWGPAPSVQFHETAKRFCLAHAERAGVIVDGTIYSKTRLFRAPNSRHPKTGLFKRRLTLDELMHLKPEAIVELARQPMPFRIPSPTVTSPTAVADWLEAGRAVERRAVEQRARVDNGAAKLTAFARRFVRDGELDADKRAVSTFRVAAELSEFFLIHGFDSLVHALLTEAALDSGLGPGEAKRQIDSGLAHARRQKEGGAL
jgi:hypothetical protein